MTTSTLADEIEALAKEAGLDKLEVDPSAYVRGANICDLVRGEFTVAEFLHNANAALIVALVNNAPAIVSALRERDALKDEVERLRGALS